MNVLNHKQWRYRRAWVLWCVMPIAGADVWATDSIESLFESWRWVRFTTHSGLPTHHVNDVVETPAGTVWAVTDLGLAWYDGYQWHGLDPPHVLAGVRPQKVSVSGRDELVVVVDNVLYRGDTHGFRRIAIEYDHRPMRVTSAVTFTDHSILVITEDAATGVASLWVERDGAVERALQPPRFSELIETRLWRTRNGAVWLSAGSGLYRWADSQWELRLETGTTSAKFEFVVEDATESGLAFFRLPRGRAGFAEWDRGGTLQLNQNFQYCELLALDVDAAGMAYALQASGLLWIRDQGLWHSLDQVPPELYSINFLKARPHGDLWVGSKSGLLLHRRSDRRWTFWRHGEARLEDQIAEILKARDGSVWLGTGNGVEIRRGDGSVDRVNRIDGTDLVKITGIGEDSEGNIWISSGFSFAGAFRWDGDQWRHFGAADGLNAPFVHKIRKDREGRLWFLGLGEITPSVRDAGPGAFVLIDERFERWGPAEGLLNGRVYAVTQTSDHALWFGTARGISRWAAGTWKHWQKEDGLRLDRVFTMTADHDDRVWFGHQRMGLGFFDASGEPQYFTAVDGLVDDRVWDLQVDPQGRLWVSTGDGFCCYDNGTWSTYSTSAGLSSARLFPVHPLDDKIYVGTRSAGTCILDLSVNKHDPRIVLEPVVLDRTKAVVKWSAYSYGGLLEPSDLMTRYRIDEDDWSPWSRAREVVREDMSYGAHRIQVQARGFSPNFDADGATLSFDVVQPFYQRTIVVIPFLVFVASLIGLTGFLLVRRRVHAMALIRERSRAERTFRFIAEGTAAATGNDYFRSLVRHLALAIDVRYAFLTERVKGEDKRIRTLAWWTGAGFEDNIEYDVKGTPCEGVLRGEERYYPKNLQDLFPGDRELTLRAAQSYLGIPVCNSFGRILGHLGVMHVAPMQNDVSRLGIMRVFATRAAAELERRDTAIQLQRAKEAAESADRVKSEFLGNVSHEIRTPVMAMLGATELIDSKGGRSNGRLDFREVILRNGKHLVALVDDLLNAARLESGKIDVHVAACSLCEILADVHASIATAQRHSHVGFKIVLESAIPSMIRSDAIRLRQALINLVNNAFHCTEKGHVHVILKVDSGDGKPAIAIRVEDTGRGIAPKDQQRIFDRFTQVGSPGERATAGMGLGLPLTRSIAEQLGGILDVESKLGRGSTFTLRLPLDPVDDTEWIDSDAIENRLVGSQKGIHLRGRVLIAEDFSDTRELLKFAISQAGAEVTAVTNGLDAVKAAADLSFDLIILDIRMPKMDGLSAAAELRRRGIRVPIIALTASVGPDSRDRVLEAGFDDMWSKPMTLENVISFAADYLHSAERVDDGQVPAITRPENPRFAAAVDEFVQSLGNRLENLRLLVEAGDVAGAREILHQLVGAGGIHGFMELSTEAARLQEMAKNASLAHKTSELRALEMIVASTHESVAQSR